MFQKKIWDTLWEKQVISDWDESSDLVFSVLKEEIIDFKEKKILEAGSGTGRISLALAKEGANVTLVDFSEPALLQSKQRFENAGLEGEFILSDIFNMKEISDNTFDIVWNAGVIEHFDYDQQIKVFTELKRVLKPNGLLITLNPNAKCIPYQLGKWFMESTKQWSYGQEFPIFSLEKICKEVGMDFKKEYSVGFEQSLNFLSQLPHSNNIRNTIELWYNSLQEKYKENLDGYLVVTICKNSKLGESQNEFRDLYSIRERQIKESIIILSSVHLTDDLWQRAQQVASELTQHDYQVIFINNKSITLNIDCDWNKLNYIEIDQLLSRCILNSSQIVNGILMIDRIDFIKDSTGNIFYIKDSFINKVVKFFCTKESKVITYLPEYSSVLSELKRELGINIYYDCVDEMTGFHNTKKVVIDENRLIKICDGIIVTSNALFVRKGLKNTNCIIVPNGVNYNHYANIGEKPLELQNLEGPIIGYVGAIAYWFDQELICKLATMHPDWNFVLIGSIYTNVDKLELYSNIHLLGKKEYQLIARYMQNFDVGIIPFENNELIINTNPIKYYEYIAAGIPVVSTIMPELISKPYVKVTNSLNEFENEIIRYLNSDKNKLVDVDFLKENSWSERVNQILNMFNNNSEYKRKDTLQEIITTYEDNKEKLPILYLLLAEIYVELNKENIAMEYLKIFSKKSPNHSHLIQAKLYLHFNELEEVKKVLISIDNYSSYDAELWSKIGENHLRLYTLRKTLEFDKALELSDEMLVLSDRSYLEEVGNIYYDVEQYDDALNFYIEAYANCGRILSIESAINFSTILKEKGDIELAKIILDPHMLFLDNLKKKNY